MWYSKGTVSTVTYKIRVLCVSIIILYKADDHLIKSAKQLKDLGLNYLNSTPQECKKAFINAASLEREYLKSSLIACEQAYSNYLKTFQHPSWRR